MSRQAALALVVGACLAAPAAGAGLEITPILRPSLDGFEPPVAALLTERLERLEELLASPEATAERAAAELGRLGKLYLVYSLPEAAESCFVNAARLAPGEFEWTYLLGTVRQERRDLEGARSALLAARELAPEAPAVGLRLAQLEFELGDLAAAEELYLGVLEAPGFAAAASYGLGRIAAARGDLPLAIERFERALADQPEASQVRYQLGIALRRTGDLERAREQLADRGSGQLSFPDPVLEGLGEGAPGVEVYLSAGRVARTQGDFETAIAAFRKVVEAQPDEPDHRAVLGATLLESGRVEESVAVYRETLARHPGDAAALYNLALGLVELGEVEEAKAHLQRLVELVPDHVDGRVNLATLCEQSGDLARAEALLAEAIALDPYQPGLRVHRASVLTSIGRATEARRDLRAVLDEDPGNAEALVVLGAANEALGSPGDALAAWQAVLELGAGAETEARARFFLGRSYLQRGQPAAAVDHLRAAAAVLPDSSQLRLLLAGALGAVRDFDGAVAQYSAVLERDPADENASFGKAISLLLAGREAEARAHLERSLEAAPASLPLRHLLARLLATAVEPSVRDGARALELAREVFERAQTLTHAETLAMAHAELGQFDAALEWQGRIIELARAGGQSARLPELEARRTQFERREPVRAPWREGH